MGFFSNFGGTIKKNAKRDINHLRGDGAVEKADIIYERIKSAFTGTWNIVIDKVIDLILKSMGKDIQVIVKECKSAGKNPVDYFPDNLKMRLRKSYA